MFFNKLKICEIYVNVIMDISLISIGNSKGVRLSKTLLEKYNIKGTLELILEKGYIILKPKTSSRKGWEKSFKKMHENGGEKALMVDVFEDENIKEWNYAKQKVKKK